MILLWDVRSGRSEISPAGHQNSVNALAWSPDGLWLISGSADRTLKLWSMPEGRLVRTFAD
jgi:WD40 repeat protein